MISEITELEIVSDRKKKYVEYIKRVESVSNHSFSELLEMEICKQVGLNYGLTESEINEIQKV